MSDETHLGRARQLYMTNASIDGVKWRVLNAILSHLEQQSAPVAAATSREEFEALRAWVAEIESKMVVKSAQAPEAAPERATRDEVWSVAPAESLTTEEWRHWYMRAQETGEAAQRQVAELEGQLKALQPSAVQGEERTARVENACVPPYLHVFEMTALALEYSDGLFQPKCLCQAYQIEIDKVTAVASSSPTATAQRGVGPDSSLERVWRNAEDTVYDPPESRADPLPAQTEPGLCSCAEQRDCMNTIDCRLVRLKPLATPPQPPSPAPECAHRWGQFTLFPNIKQCRKCSTIVITPSLPTEGEG